ncbi:MAG: ArgE/DapE family deacylase [Bacteroidota bacterium]
MNLPIDRPFITDTLSKLVQINSINPSLVSGSPGEVEIGQYIASQLEALRVETSVEAVDGDRSNVIGFIQGSGHGKSLMLNAHMDTVGVDGMEDPFGARIEDGKLYGRGSQDMKGSIAAMLGAVKALKDASIKLKGDIYLSFVIDEEYASLGTEDVIKKYKTDAAIVTEPTSLDICIAHRGFGNFEIKTFGKQAHGGSPEDGIDANMLMGHAMLELSKLSNHLQERAPHPYLGHSSLHIPQIAGGKQLFIYADQCTLQYERRTLPKETEDSITREIRSVLDRLEQSVPNFRYQLRKLVYRDAFEVAPEKEIVKLTQAATNKVLGHITPFIGHGWWEDSSLFAQNGADTVIIGPKGHGIHGPVEWVDLQSVGDLSSILLDVLINYCGSNEA